MRVSKFALITILCLSSAPALSQQERPKNVEVVVNDTASTSELKEIRIGASPSLSVASIGIMYFGPKSESDISFLMFLEGAKGRYSKGATYGVRLFAGDTPLSGNRLRMIDKITKDGARDVLAIHLTTEDIAWLVSGSTAKIELFDGDADKRLDTLFFTPTTFKELKAFAQSVLLIKGTYD